MLAQVALGPVARFVAFDDLLAVTMGTADSDKGHGPLLAVGHSQDWAQGVMNLSLSPLLKHYLRLDLSATAAAEPTPALAIAAAP
jgi:hypothetical protein